MNQENITALFGVIYDKYYKKILRFFRRDFAVEDAEDLPQQAFLRLWAWLPQADSVKNGGALIYSIAKTVRADRFRKTALMLDTLPLYDFVEVPAPPGCFNAAETRAALQTLGAKERERLLMKVQGYSSEEIGRAFGISASAVRSRLQKIKKKLKDDLFNC